MAVEPQAEGRQMEERSRRIVETAVELAEEGGFEAVRLREVASHAGVALGTLYRRFRSKEDLLIAALELETQDLEQRMRQKPAKGATGFERIDAFFGTATKGLLRRPNLARALLRATVSGNPELARRVARFHTNMEILIVASLRGAAVGSLDGGVAPPTETEMKIADTLEQVWFALLVGWSGGQHSQAAMMDKMRASTELVLRGARETT
jgi:AcrR family transcriptional regulator